MEYLLVAAASLGYYFTLLIVAFDLKNFDILMKYKK